MLKLYENIKNRRLELGLTQTQLADKLGYADKSMIAKIEKGSIDLPQSKILAFANALNLSPGDLMGWEDSSSSASDQTDTLFIEKYGQPVYDAAMTFAALDDIDQGRITERMGMLLEDDKYKRDSEPGEKAI